MKESNNKGMLAAVVVIAVLVLGGLFLVLNNDESDTDTETTDTTQTDQAVEQPAPSDIVALASETDSLSTLVAAVQAADLVETLQGDGPFTVFAPTNEAFDALPDGTLDTLLEPANQGQLVDVLTYHVVAGEVFAADLSDGQVVETLQGETLTVEIRDGMVYIIDAAGGEALVQTADVDASNGVVHLIDSVLLTS